MKLLIFCACVYLLTGIQARKCQYQPGKYTPFFQEAYNELCSEQACQEYDPYACTYPAETVKDAVEQHANTTGQNITQEIIYLNRYFNSETPDSYAHVPFRCAGGCSRSMTQLKYVWHIAEWIDEYTKEKMTEKQMCYVIAPQKIFYSDCAGKCHLPEMRGLSRRPYYCCPDKTFDIDVWVFCEYSDPSCIKKRLTLPLSCSCKLVTCLAPVPELIKKTPPGIHQADLGGEPVIDWGLSQQSGLVPKLGPGPKPGPHPGPGPKPQPGPGTKPVWKPGPHPGPGPKPNSKPQTGPLPSPNW